MMTAMLTVRNIEAGERIYDIWQVNEDAEYHEAGDEGARSHAALDRAIGNRPSLSTGERAAMNSLREVPARILSGNRTPDGTSRAA